MCTNPSYQEDKGEENVKNPRNDFTKLQNGQVYHYLKINRASLKRDNLTYLQAATRIAKKLGFRVTIDNLKGMLNVDKSLVWSQRQFGQRNKTKAVQPVNDTYKEVMQLRRIVELLEERLNEEIAVVGRAHIRLANDLGTEYENDILTRLERRSPRVVRKSVHPK